MALYLGFEQLRQFLSKTYITSRFDECETLASLCSLRVFMLSSSKK